MASCSGRGMPLHATFETETSRLHYSAAAALLKNHTSFNCYCIKRQHRILWQQGTSSLKGCVCVIFIVPTPACEFCELMYGDPLRENVVSVVRRIHGHSDPIRTQEAQILGSENAQAACASPTFTLLIPLFSPHRCCRRRRDRMVRGSSDDFGTFETITTAIFIQEVTHSWHCHQVRQCIQSFKDSNP